MLFLKKNIFFFKKKFSGKDRGVLLIKISKWMFLFCRKIEMFDAKVRLKKDINQRA